MPVKRIRYGHVTFGQHVISTFKLLSSKLLRFDVAFRPLRPSLTNPRVVFNFENERSQLLHGVRTRMCFNNERLHYIRKTTERFSTRVSWVKNSGRTYVLNVNFDCWSEVGHYALHAIELLCVPCIPLEYWVRHIVE